MREFIDLLLNDSVFFLIGITIIVLIILIIICVVLLKKKYDIVEVKDSDEVNYDNNITKLNTLVNEQVKSIEEPKAIEVEASSIESNDNKIDLEAMLSKMEETLNEKDKAIANFEQEQEEKAIISYEELKKAVNQNSNTNVTKVDSLEPKVPVINEIKKEATVTNSTKNFKNTDFISPIYGKMDNNYEYPTISNFDEEMVEEPKEDIVSAKHSKNNNEVFLDSLKQFRKNLE